MAAPLYTTASGQLFHAGKILIATVGLPARGKTHLSHALERYLRWLGVKAVAMSLGDYRREVLGGAENLPPDYFLDGPKSPQTQQLRNRILGEFDDSVVDFFMTGGQVVIYDANNGTQKRRYAIREKFGKLGIHVMFMESICTDQSIVEANVRSVKISSPDYVNWNPDKAVEDFYKRIKGHEKNYEPIENPSFPYVKVINVGQKIVVNNIQGYLQSRVVFFLMNIHNRQRTIYFARAGEALIEHLYKADADLSSLGWQYSKRLCEFLTRYREENAEEAHRRAQGGVMSPGGYQPGTGPGEAGRSMEVWTSARKRSAHTALAFADKGYRIIERSQLSEINPGVVDGLDQDEIRAQFPDEWDKKLRDPYAHRYPRAESYHDLSVRLEPIIFELERATSDVLIVGQSSVLRCLIAYCQGRKPQEIPGISVKEGELWEMSPQAYGINTKIIEFWDSDRERQIRDENYYRERKLSDSMHDLTVRHGRAPKVSLFRPCIDIHDGKVKQIVGGTLSDTVSEAVKTNFVATHSPAHYAQLYRQHGLSGAHVIKLGPGGANDSAAEEALKAWPGSLQIGGGITDKNAEEWILKGASKVIVTSYLFLDGKFSLERLQTISRLVGKDRLVVDVSCRRQEVPAPPPEEQSLRPATTSTSTGTDGAQQDDSTAAAAASAASVASAAAIAAVPPAELKWIVAMNRWQTLTDMEVNATSLSLLAEYCSEFLIHAADVEGLCQGIDEDLVGRLGRWTTIPTTYAGGARHMGDLDLVNRISGGRVDLTFGSALDIFGGTGVTLGELVQWNRHQGGQGEEGEDDEDEEDEEDEERRHSTEDEMTETERDVDDTIR